MMLLDE